MVSAVVNISAPKENCENPFPTQMKGFTSAPTNDCVVHNMQECQVTTDYAKASKKACRKLFVSDSEEKSKMSEGEVVQESATSSSKNYENKYACLCTSCHRRYARKMCVLFRKCNYNFSIKTVSNSLEKSRRCKESGAPEFICKNCHKFFSKNKYKSTIGDINKCVEQSVNTTLISTTTAVEVQKDFQEGQIPLVNSSNLPSDEFMPLEELVLDTVSDCSLTCVPTGSANFIEKEGGN